MFLYLIYLGDKETLIENESMELKMNKASEWKNYSEGKIDKIESRALNFAEKEVDEKRYFNVFLIISIFDFFEVAVSQVYCFYLESKPLIVVLA